MSPLEILLIICLIAAAVAVVNYEKNERHHVRLIHQLNRTNTSLLHITNITAEALCATAEQNIALRKEAAASLLSPEEDAALTFDAVATEAVAVTKEQAA